MADLFLAGMGFSSSSFFVIMMEHEVQKPHWKAPASMKACWTGSSVWPLVSKTAFTLMELALRYFVICLGGINEPPRLLVHFNLGASGSKGLEGRQFVPNPGLISVSPQIPA